MATEFMLNGKPARAEADAQTPLLWVLREDLELTGTKYGCGMGLCGACTVHLDGTPVRSCSLPLSLAAGRSVTTIEGLGADGMHPLQQDRRKRTAVRLLPVWPDHVCRSAARG